MTWYFDVTGTRLDIYDHTGALVAEGQAFSGVWSDYPDEMFAVMQAEAEEALAIGNTERVLRIIAQAAFEDIEEGIP